MTSHITAELQQITRISPSTRIFRFLTHSSSASFLAGQFYRFTFTDDAGSFERSYSLCNQVEDQGKGLLDLMVSEVDKGRATQVLFNASVGLQVSIKGPYGRLVLPQPIPAKIVLVATSVGLAPFIPMLSMMAASPSDEVRSLVLILGVRDRSEFLCAEWLLGLRKKLPCFELLVCYSRETASNLESYERSGYVTAAMAEQPYDPHTDFFMLCGNPLMVDDAFALLKRLGFSGRRVRREKYVFARQEKPNLKPRSLSKNERDLLSEKIKRYGK